MQLKEMIDYISTATAINSTKTSYMVETADVETNEVVHIVYPDQCQRLDELVKEATDSVAKCMTYLALPSVALTAAAAPLSATLDSLATTKKDPPRQDVKMEDDDDDFNLVNYDFMDAESKMDMDTPTSAQRSGAICGKKTTPPPETNSTAGKSSKKYAGTPFDIKQRLSVKSLRDFDSQEERDNRQRLKELIVTLCSFKLQALDASTLSQFDPLQGKPAHHYGLSAACWKQELMMVLQVCPHFKYKKRPKLLSRLLGLSSVNTVQDYVATNKALLDGILPAKLSRQKGAGQSFHPDKSRIVQEVLAFGFDTFDAFTAKDIKRTGSVLTITSNSDLDLAPPPPPPSCLPKSLTSPFERASCRTKLSDKDFSIQPDETLGEILDGGDEEDEDFAIIMEEEEEETVMDNFGGDEAKKRKVKPKTFTSWKVDLSNPCIDWFKTLAPGATFVVAVPKPPFQLNQFTCYNKQVLPYIHKEKVIALLGLTVSGNSDVIQAQVLLRPHRAVCHQSDLDILSVFQVLRDSFGVSDEDCFKSLRYVSGEYHYIKEKILKPKEREAVVALDKWQVAKFATQKKEELDAVTARRKERNVAVDLASLSDDDHEKRRRVTLRLVDKLDTSRINCVGFLMGGDASQLTFRAAFDEKVMQGYEKEVVIKQKCKLSHFTRVFMEIFEFFNHGVSSLGICQKLPLFKAKYDEVRGAFNWVRFLEAHVTGAQSKVQCPTCGLVLEDMRHPETHMKKCALERTTCDCVLNFKSPAVKRRHMDLVHSGKTFFECAQCPFYSLNRSVVDNHIASIHGFPGLQHACDLCFKCFGSPNSLRIHQFSHELHFCAICQIEIQGGRNGHKNHMKKVHAAGHSCDVCSKLLFTKKELIVHKKMAHDTSWATSY